MRPEVDPEVQPEVVLEVQPEVVPEVQPEVVPEVQPEVVPEVQPKVVLVLGVELEDKKLTSKNLRPPGVDHNSRP